MTGLCLPEKELIVNLSMIMVVLMVTRCEPADPELRMGAVLHHGRRFVCRQAPRLGWSELWGGIHCLLCG